jgi:hypothetical protein
VSYWKVRLIMIQLEVLAARLAELYPDEGSIRRVLGAAQVYMARVPFDGTAANTWWFACVEARRQRKLRELVHVAVLEYPLDDVLVTAARLLVV